jgi:hypothetical protein
MSFSEITIYRPLRVVRGKVILPKEQNPDNVQVDAYDAMTSVGGSVVHLTGGSGRANGQRCGAQEVLFLPGVTPDAWYATNPVQAIIDG